MLQAVVSKSIVCLVGNRRERKGKGEGLVGLKEWEKGKCFAGPTPMKT